MLLTPYVPLDLVAARLPRIFPDGMPNRTYCVRDVAVKTVFSALYIGAVQGSNHYLAPAHAYRMSTGQAALAGDGQRQAYEQSATGKKYLPIGERWYADNSRESVRDETLRDGLVPAGAVLVDASIPTTSAKGRYQLKQEFAELFDPALSGDGLDRAITAYQASHLSKSALARIAIQQAGAIANTTGTRVTFPNGETRQLAPGPSTAIAQAVIEVFAPCFLQQPAVLWLSESGNKVVVRDEKLAAKLGLHIQADKFLPDLILADIGTAEPLIVFVELVATDGAITPQRQEALYAITDAAGFDRAQVAFMTAYADRQSSGFRKTIPHLAWNSFAWIASEPQHLVMMIDGDIDPQPLSVLLKQHG